MTSQCWKTKLLSVLKLPFGCEAESVKQMQKRKKASVLRFPGPYSNMECWDAQHFGYSYSWRTDSFRHLFGIFIRGKCCSWIQFSLSQYIHNIFFLCSYFTLMWGHQYEWPPYIHNLALAPLIFPPILPQFSGPVLHTQCQGLKFCRLLFSTSKILSEYFLWIFDRSLLFWFPMTAEIMVMLPFILWLQFTIPTWFIFHFFITILIFSTTTLNRTGGSTSLRLKLEAEERGTPWVSNHSFPKVFTSFLLGLWS